VANAQLAKSIRHIAVKIAGPCRKQVEFHGLARGVTRRDRYSASLPQCGRAQTARRDAAGGRPCSHPCAPEVARLPLDAKVEISAIAVHP
jgi:enamine deaminase RidA (YjgF/YER057c/UK114 family)